MSAYDFLWFLLPVAAAFGWLAGRKSVQSRQNGFWDYSQHFHEELGQLLSEQEADAAVFGSFTDGETDALDTHLALGNLYRRRGEIERALRVHESILERQKIDSDMQALAQLELARDYEAAGLFDRSAEIFQNLTASGPQRDEAYQGLLQLHEREQDWQQALAVALQCEQQTGRDLSQPIAHYYCELASIETADNDEPANAENARQRLQQALQRRPDSARAYVQLATMAVASGDHRQAIEYFNKLESINAALMPLVIEQQFAALKAVGDQQALESFIKHIQSQKNAYSVIRTTRRVIAEFAGEQVADRFFKDQILKRPSLKGLRDWAHDQLLISKPGEREKVQIICDLLDQVMEDKPAYRCRSCGFAGNVMHWRCPGCARWDTVSTIIGVEGE